MWRKILSTGYGFFLLLIERILLACFILQHYLVDRQIKSHRRENEQVEMDIRFKTAYADDTFSAAG